MNDEQDDVADTSAKNDDQAPSTDDHLHDWMLLNLVNGIGPRLRRNLLDRFETATHVLNANPSELREVPGLGPKLPRNVVAARGEIDVDSELQLARVNRIELVDEQDERFPRMLREIVDPPGILYVDGRILPQDDMAIAIVGTRHPSQYGLKIAEQLAGELSRAGLTIVSGMARGIDAAAHRAALAAGGRTIAVLGSGLLQIYPPEHKELAMEIAAQGAVVSESPLMRPPRGDAFPQRNRIVTGMSLGVIVVEAAARSGALISARLAMEQGREVFAVPGRIDQRMSFGCHSLIRDGAKLVQSVDDVLEELGPLVGSTSDSEGNTVRHPAELKLNEHERAVLNHIDLEPIQIDLLVSRTGLPIHNILSTISVLEMRHLIRRLNGTTVVRK